MNPYTDGLEVKFEDNTTAIVRESDFESFSPVNCNGKKYNFRFDIDKNEWIAVSIGVIAGMNEKYYYKEK